MDYPLPYHRSRHHRSHRGARYRRNAAIGIILGITAIVCGIALVLDRRGLLLPRPTAFFSGIIVFFVGYCTVIAGCWSWVKAKALNDAILIIGLAPIFLLFIPFVRLLLFIAPQLIVVGMIMMPLILISIIAVLPSQR
ncbi:MAG: hypothetical protein PHQ12_07700 [Chthoniobacteraceae bacterium]|nr:hypothetical protein [Chthoniobacteraceae bacterium]